MTDTSTPIVFDRDTEALARRLAQAAGVSVESIVKQALSELAEGTDLGGAPSPPLDGQSLVDRLREISDHAAALPVRDARTPDQIIGYDEHGLPE